MHGFKQPLRPQSRNTWEEILKHSAEYFLSLRTHDSTNQFLVTHQRKTFITGFVTTNKSTIDMSHMTTSMFSGENAFKYLLTYRFSQDHIELLFSCIRAQGGWNNNPNCLQLKYAMRKMLLRNTITASKNANCLTFSDSTTTIIPKMQKFPDIFHGFGIRARPEWTRFIRIGPTRLRGLSHPYRLYRGFFGSCLRINLRER